MIQSEMIEAHVITSHIKDRIRTAEPTRFKSHNEVLSLSSARLMRTKFVSLWSGLSSSILPLSHASEIISTASELFSASTMNACASVRYMATLNLAMI